jgi:hypothetical protein
MQLHFLAKREFGQFNEVEGFAAVVLDYPIGDGQRFEVLVYYGKFVFGT